jgi:hypothetical protein
MTVPLVEEAGAAGSPGQPQATTMVQDGPATADQPAPALDFQPGGGAGKPVVRIGSTTLGYEDVIMLLVLVQALATVAKYIEEVR